MSRQVDMTWLKKSSRNLTVGQRALSAVIVICALANWSLAQTTVTGLPTAADASRASNTATSLASAANPSAWTADDWPCWRGMGRNGIASSDQHPPTAWSPSKNVAWRAKIPGRGHSSPTVIGDRVLIATADPVRETQSVVCFSRDSGQLLWETTIHHGGLMRKNEKSNEASSTVACDGKFAFINFLNAGAVYTTCLNMDGQKVWQTMICDYVIHQGFGSSPVIYKDLLLVSADNKGGGVIAALARHDGQVAWRRERPEMPNYPSPVVLHAAGQDQLVMTGCEQVTSLDPLTGETRWEIEGATTECVTSAVTDGTRVFTSGGYPRNHVSAIAADGTGTVAWENGDRVYVPSMLVRDESLYAILDAGIAACWDSATGKPHWKQRLGGTFTSSPVFVGERIYATNEAGTTFVFKATPNEFKLIAKNELGGTVLATAAICRSRVYLRVTTEEDGAPQDYLYCIAESSTLR